MTSIINRFILAGIASISVLNLAGGQIDQRMATAVANAFVMSQSPIDEDRTEVTNVVAQKIGAETAYYVAYRKGGGALIISPDDRMRPIMAVVNKIDLSGKAPIWDMTNVGATNALALVKSIDNKSASPRGVDVDAYNRKCLRNKNEWNKMVEAGRFHSKKSEDNDNRRSSSTFSGRHIIPGFETGGKYTHWNQTVVKGPYAGTAPCYNYYMLSESSGGTDANGLRCVYDNPSTPIPCGCVATAMSVEAQVLKMGGISNSSTYKLDVLQLPVTNIYGWTAITNATLIKGTYDWDSLPSNFGGNAPAVSTDAELGISGRELLGRVAYNMGLSVDMEYGIGGSGAYNTNIVGGVNGEVGIKIFRDTVDSFGTYWRQYDVYHPVVGWNDGLKSQLKRIKAYMNANIPIVLTVFGHFSGGHAINAVGWYEDGLDTAYTKLFMGWGGSSDAWVSLDNDFSISSFYVVTTVTYPSGPNNLSLPFYGNANADVVATQSGYVSPYIVQGSDYGFSGLGYAPSLTTTEWTSSISLSSGNFSYTIPITSERSGDYYIPAINDSFLNNLPVVLGEIKNGFDFGTPTSIAVAIQGAASRRRPLLVVCSSSYSDDAAMQILRKNKSYIDGNFVSYFVDYDSDKSNKMVDCKTSYAVFDSSAAESEVQHFWISTNGRLSYGTFDNELDLMRVLSEGKEKFEKGN